MSTRRPYRTFLAACALVLGTALVRPAQAQGTALVPLSDVVYQDLDRLAELGVLESVVVGQRPYSRREIARIVHDATEGVGRRVARDGAGAANTSANAILQVLSMRFVDAETAGRGHVPYVDLLDGSALTATSNTEERRALVGLAREVEATIGVFGQRRLGEPPLRGNGVALELEQRLEATPWLAFSARERFEARSPHDSTAPRRAAELLLGTARARHRNLALTIGRTQVAWAQREDAGLLLSFDAPALDQVSLASDVPFRLPGFLGRAGDVKATALYANLGRSTVRSHSQLVAYKVSVTPNDAVEIGGSFLGHFGGEGARPTSFGDRLVDLLPFVDIFRRHNYSDTTSTLEAESDKALGLDGRVRLAPLGGLVLAGEVIIDDFDVHRIPTLFTWDGSQTLDVIVPRIGSSDVSLDLSVKHMGVRAYSHHQLTGGLTTRGQLLGSELGNDAKAFGATLAWTPGSATRFALEGRSAIHSRAEYTTDANGTYFAIRRVGDASNELRDRVIGSVTLQPIDGFVFRMRLGAARFRNYEFGGTTHRDYLADVSLRINR